MHDIRRLGLQVFAAPNNLTGEVQVQVKAREIDFVTSFGKNLQALLDILGITRMIRKENNSVLKTKTVKGELQSGDVGEGEEIPMSRYTVEEKPFDTIKIEKYRKGVSLEAISEKGYEAAVQDTDDEFKSDLQNVVTDKFYAQLKAGSLTGHETTWQMAVAMAIGKVVAKFQKMKRTATGVAVWVNTLDVYKYLGAADITLQTAFGFKYLTNFLGADVVFVTSEIPQNIVIATPLNNMIAYYVDPGDSEFAKAGLGFTTDSETGFIGFHSEGTYSRMISDNYAIMGLRLFCEYLDAIAYISVGESDTQTLGTLNVTSEAGSEAGTTKLTVKEQLMSMRNCWKYKDAAATTAVTYGMDVKNWSKWDGESEIASTATHHITLVECDQNYKAVRSGDVTVTVTKVDNKANREWTLLKNQTSAGNSTITVDVSQYSEFMITCGLASSTNGNYYRELASTIVPAQVLTSRSVVDHGSGSHQAYYSSAYNGGISYLSSNKIKIYNNGGITRLYAR